MQKHFSDLEIVQNLQEGKLIEETTKFLYYSAYGYVRHRVRQRGMDVEDAKDLFQDALIVFIENVVKGKYDVERVKVTTYIYSIAENLRIKTLIRNKKRTSWEGEYVDKFSIIDLSNENFEDDFLAIKQAFQKLGDKCQAILRAFYMEDQSLEEIAQELGYTYLSAKQTKFRCLEKLKQLSNLS
ncbi:RNA polymerase sigma factor [Spirosoma endophyticum]|uniref:RNA polymerase sigma factor, sigma-70 family n=1 Tax=Spirosoma endophyticum TaxID=662367 RepID=A0A1I2GE23_9BACT|nr:sigma-70 family RNA polymerase sigma factor [Spirosoma endophyticum]SFF15157.1 RNA polymerase sigma factor, sigma-70 family [Spirosoma endophyticum]